MLRFWYDGTGTVVEAFDIEGFADKEYNDGDVAEVQDSYGFTHTIDKRSGSDKQIAAVTISFPAGSLDKLNADTPTVAFRTYLLANYKSKAQVQVFDDDGLLAYKGTITAVDKLIRSNLSIFDAQKTDLVFIRMILDAQGVYTTLATIGSTTYDARP